MSSSLILKELTAADLKEMMVDAVNSCLQQSEPKESSTEKDDDLITIEQAAKLLHISRPTLHKWKKQGTIQQYRLCGRVYFRRSEILNSLKTIKRKEI